jgi:membrane protease YdiL (CAAX protease family)
VSPKATFWATAAVLAAFNVARAIGAFWRLGDLVGLVVALGLTWWALRSGRSVDGLGLGRDRVRSGLAWGGGAFALVLAVVVAAAIVPGTSDFLQDDRARISLPALLFEVGISILVLTVIPEELTFRGVLLGSGVEAWGRRKGMLASSALFGLWHIAPTLGTSAGNAQLSDVTSSSGGRAGIVAGAVLTTFVAGMVFSWLRMRSGSVVAPMLAHLATNGVTLVVAWFALR